ncbi:fibrillarin-like rRNA/tRNA 2'-O-methyltransferase [Thermoproteus tenax]|uniref:Fibrillarin-like rRNA/tRNA 2'-O-methyltransferase n=1 Tax=Thermoproteus tenax (strain ATCC 35583 / DSM 2078 / JCM 9277 / NBRC 100435 / Kra 1) TaxID=768679 RepID=G4RKZ1_THETK|nr:fibrillarin-like rRNA/tRNA 2'-O-methyltransferase [Thermoproteus tenax]CCC82236.1 fibrillarin-like pre-rRNA processing protein [Thermoproteus tenax Kra 1]
MSISVVEVRPHDKFVGVYVIKFEDGTERLATRNLTPGKRVYGERLVKWQDVEYREWNPYRSKLAAAILNGLKVMPIGEGSHVLYLGAASGTTPSHVSDIVGDKGLIYSVEFSPRVFREFMEKLVDQGRRNVVPILGDARFPYQYAQYIKGVDIAYIDIAQPAQAKILADNADYFLRKGGHVMLVIKAMSIDVTREPSETFKQEINALKERGFDVLDIVHLEPYDVAHAMVIARRV